MFVENQNYADSLLFLGSARIALANIVKESTVKNKKQLVSYIYNEATDYEIMGLLVEGTLPDEKSNPVEEARLWNEFKILMIANKNLVSEVVGSDGFVNVLTEVDSIYPLQSAHSLFEYSMELYGDEIINEQEPRSLASDLKNLLQVIKDKSPEAKEKVNQALKKAKAFIDAKDKKVKQQMVTGADREAARKTASDLKSDIANLKSAARNNPNISQSQIASIKAQNIGAVPAADIKSLAGATGAAARGPKIDYSKMDKSLKGDIVAKGAGERARSARQAMQQAGLDKELKAGATGAARTKDMLGARGQGPNDPTIVSSSQIPGGTPKKVPGGWEKFLRDKIQAAKDLGPKISKFAKSPAGLAIGGAALGALAIYGATKTYKRFFSKAAKACAGMSGGDKTRCMNRYKVQGLQSQIKDLKTGASACSKSKNPDKCQGAITSKIASLQKRIGKLQKRGA